MQPRQKTATRRRVVHRSEVLDAASRIVVRDGPAALSVRRLAAELGTSTMVLYTHFEGGKEELMAAVRAEGFRRFADELAGAGGSTPIERLRAQGRAYRAFGRRNPTYYQMMWSGKNRPDEPARHDGERAFGLLVAVVTAVLAERGRPAAEVMGAALFVWSAAHGALLLELSGIHPDEPAAAAAWESVLDRIQAALTAPLPS